MTASKFLSILLLFTACTAVKLQVPEAFKQEAESMPVKGVNGWMINQQLHFGPYKTTNVKRGWSLEKSAQWTKWRMNPEEVLLRVFDIHTDRKKLSQHNRLQYAISDSTRTAEVFATEDFKENQLVYKSNNPYLGSANSTNNYQYAYAAAIVPFGLAADDPWSLVLIARYDRKKDTARRLFDLPYVEEEGYATNGKESIAIRPLRLEKASNKSGKDLKMAAPLLSGYELHWDGGLVAVIDILDNQVWLHRELDGDDRFILSALASAILLKKIQDATDVDTDDSEPIKFKKKKTPAPATTD